MEVADGSGHDATSSATAQQLPPLQLDHTRDTQQQEELSTSSPEDGAFELASPANPYLASPSTMMAAKRKQQSEQSAYALQQDGAGGDDVRRNYHEHFQKVLDGETLTRSGFSNSSVASTTSFQQQQQQNHTPHLQNHNIASQSINSEDDSTDFAHVTYGELAQPRPEIVLRWKRFGVLVVIAFGAIAGATALLVQGFELTAVQNADEAERKVDTINSYSGIVMGFFESFLGLLLGNLLPVYIVYLHNLKWFPGDDPAVKSSKFKKVALMLFIPLVMVALGNSFSAVQANQRIESIVSRRMQARHLQQQPSEQPGRRLSTFEQQQSASDTNMVVLPLEETILRSAVTRRVVPASSASASSCFNVDANADEQRGLLNALPSATFGFPMKSWHREMYPDPASWGSTKKLQIQDSVEIGDVMAYATAFELLDLGMSQFKRSLVGTKDVRIESRSIGAQTASTSGFLSQISSGFQKLNLSILDTGGLTSTVQRSVVSSLIQMETLTIEVPLKCEDLVPSKLVCSAQSCLFQEQEGADRRSLPRKQITMMQYLRNCTAVSDESCQAAPDAAFMYGFTTTAYGETQSSPAKRLLVLSFGKLSWRFDDFLHVCGAGTAGTEDNSPDCRVLHHKLMPSGRHVVVGANSVPAAPSFANPVHLVQLIERMPAIGVLTNGHQVANAMGSPPKNCSPAVDAYLQFITKNHLSLDEHLVQPMYTAALFYLFQRGAVVDAAETAEIAVSRRLQDGTTSDSVKVYLSNTNIGQTSTWMGCGVILILSILVIVLPNERARLEPPKGGNARAERFIAVQTEESYPNLVYKKRFLIGKTGEEIKFGEFAVESVGLHHKMEEDEQIYL